MPRATGLPMGRVQMLKTSAIRACVQCVAIDVAPLSPETAESSFGEAK